MRPGEFEYRFREPYATPQEKGAPAPVQSRTEEHAMIIERNVPVALRDGVTCLNAPGTIDADYRGPIGVILANLGSAPVTIRRGDRIAQLVVAPVSRAQFELVDELPESTRGVGGFGSTGVAR